VSKSGQIYAIVGLNLPYALTLALAPVTGPGTISLNLATSNGSSAIVSTAAVAWGTGFTGASGTVVITVLTANRICGDLFVRCSAGVGIGDGHVAGAERDVRRRVLIAAPRSVPPTGSPLHTSGQERWSQCSGIAGKRSLLAGSSKRWYLVAHPKMAVPIATPARQVTAIGRRRADRHRRRSCERAVPGRHAAALSRRIERPPAREPGAQ
jgi:hypothetical protein